MSTAPKEPDMKKNLFAALICVLAAAAAAQDYALYDRPTESGGISITGKRFSLNTASQRGNLCDLEGSIQNKEYRDGKGCVVRFRFSGKDRVELEVPESAQTACREYCGLNAGFTGSYAVLPAACTEQGGQAAEKRFQTAYRAKQYRQAAQIKQQYIASCGKFISFTERMHAANDLAVSHKNAGDKAACRRALAAIKTWLDPEFDPGYIYEEDYKREAEAAAFNKKQCL